MPAAKKFCGGGVFGLPASCGFPADCPKHRARVSGETAFRQKT